MGCLLIINFLKTTYSYSYCMNECEFTKDIMNGINDV